MNFYRQSVLVVCSLLLSNFAAAQQPLREGSVEALNISVNFGSAPPRELVQWSRVEQRLGTKYLRIHFSDIADNSNVDYKILFFNRNGNEVAAIGKADFGRAGDFWTKIIDGDYVRVEVRAASLPTGLVFKLSEIAFQKNMGAPFSITIPDEREAIEVYSNVPELFERGRAVAKLTYVNNGFSFVCTGFMIDDDRMLTNEHCINRADICKTMIATFDYQVSSTGNLNLGKQFPCAKFIDANAELDVALISLADKPGTTYGRLKLSDRQAIKDEQTYMIQHPAGEPKQISRKDCSVTTLIADGNKKDSDFGHKCDTLGGSSGSPVLGSDFTVVGLHHFGFDSGDVKWRAENRAVHISAIATWVRSQPQ